MVYLTFLACDEYHVITHNETYQEEGIISSCEINAHSSCLERNQHNLQYQSLHKNIILSKMMTQIEDGAKDT